jgi:hypothetical protein
MQFAMMSTAQWDREFITDLSSTCSALCKSQVVRIGRTPAGAAQDGQERFFRSFGRWQFWSTPVLSAQATL